jgi:DNA-binding beta-propeller fold protein YncE
VAVDAAGNVFVAEDYRCRIQMFTATGTFLVSWGMPGTGNGQLNNPRGLATDASGNLYVVDTNNNRIQVFGTGATPSKASTWGGLKAIYR